MSLLLTLEGLSQAWLCAPRTDFKDDIARTRPHPTLSGVAGLLGAALGYEFGHTHTWLSEMSMAARVDDAGSVEVDYQTVAYPTKGGNVKRLFAKRNTNTLIARKEYLFGAKFTVALDGDAERLAEAAEALSNPHFTVFLGSKNCPPSAPISPRLVDTPVYEAVADGVHTVYADERVLSGEVRERGFKETVADVPVFDGDVLHRKWRTRTVYRIDPAMSGGDHDYFKELLR